METLIHSGRREFSEGNYFRAIEDFRLALLLNPNNGHASFYLSKAKQSLDDDIKKNMEKGKQEHESKKLQAAIVSYCGVLQLIQNYPDDERYKNAQLQISAIESELGMEKGEVKCFETKSAESKN
jgi:tetratricopeptide (TPR) repeat protein